ncbi:biotin--[acetyl-CoA-carboxylase] ligase [Nocardioides sp.]|uniref:biotin--[acetyl-CoA-carboxylase] ligase n=1 Tax=Nocardioides sp. TaxID=35761 RepID=UPI002B273132|nr:biotin--[acetyl-CoA-carboxylase] ligase [Nocardioides sp.]
MTSDRAARPPLDKTRLKQANPELVPDLTVEVADELPSTNAVAAARAREGAPDGLVVVADHQRAGRGRLDRTWESPAGTSVTFSLLLRPTAPTRSWPWIPLLTGYAVDKALKALWGTEAGVPAVGVKWPNDVLIGERKVAGILVERIDTPDGPAAVVGVGINVGLREDELPVPHATSLEIELARPVDRTDVLVDVLSAIREAFDAWEAGGESRNARLAESYAAACVTVGRTVRVDLPDGSVLVGVATGIDADGQLLVDADGGVRAVAAGDVVHVRAVG